MIMAIDAYYQTLCRIPIGSVHVTIWVVIICENICQQRTCVWEAFCKHGKGK